MTFQSSNKTTENNIPEKMLLEIRRSEIAPQKFLEAWKKGVLIIGWEYFYFSSPLSGGVKPVETLSDVTSKWQVCPNYEFIHKHINVLSSGEITLLAVMCSFYNSVWGGDLMKDHGILGMADISVKLDYEELDIISDLLTNYAGW